MRPSLSRIRYRPRPHTHATFQNFVGLGAGGRRPVRALMDPWTHGGKTMELSYAGDVEFGPDAALPSFDQREAAGFHGWCVRPTGRSCPRTEERAPASGEFGDYGTPGWRTRSLFAGGIGGEVSVAPRSVWTWKCSGSVAIGAPSHVVHHLE